MSMASAGSADVRRCGILGGTHDDVLQFAKKDAAVHPNREPYFCYEAGPHGYPSGRCLSAHGYDCTLMAPPLESPAPTGQAV